MSTITTNPEPRFTDEQLIEMLESSAQRAIDSNDVERGWMMRGAADKLIDSIDAESARDPLYGADYRSGWVMAVESIRGLTPLLPEVRDAQ